MKNLQEVLDFLDNIPAINSGGCGIAAYAVYKWLKKNNSLSEDFAIVYLHMWSYEDYNINTRFLRKKKGKAVACTHALFRHEGIFFDSHGIYTGEVSEDDSVFIESEDIDLFMKASLSSDDWNKRFQRKQHVPAIEINLGIELELEPYET